MTEKQDREIELRDLAKRFAGSNKDEARGWLKILREAVKDGRLVARERQVRMGGVARRVDNPMGASRERLERDFQTVGNTTFAGMPVRVVAPTGRQAIYEGLTYVLHIVTPAAVAAWLTKLPEQATKDIHSQGWAWLGDAWPVADVLVDTTKPASGPSHANECPPIPPGKIARVASGRLAIKAAWQIECEEGRPATDGEVMARLRAWGKSGAEPNHLLDCDKLPPGTPPAVVTAVRGGAIPWQTGKGKVNHFGLEACQKTLEKWRKSRQ